MSLDACLVPETRTLAVRLTSVSFTKTSPLPSCCISVELEMSARSRMARMRSCVENTELGAVGARPARPTETACQFFCRVNGVRSIPLLFTRTSSTGKGSECDCDTGKSGISRSGIIPGISCCAPWARSTVPGTCSAELGAEELYACMNG